MVKLIHRPDMTIVLTMDVKHQEKNNNDESKYSNTIIMIRIQRPKLPCKYIKGSNLPQGWMDDFRFSVSVISGRWEGDNERLFAMQPCLRLKRLPFHS